MEPDDIEKQKWRENGKLVSCDIKDGVLRHIVVIAEDDPRLKRIEEKLDQLSKDLYRFTR